MGKEPSTLFAHQAPRITILSDHPARDREKGSGIGEVEHIADRDLLTLESRLSPVFDILRHKNTRSPLTIAIYGTWGTGKTSAMRWLETRLCEWNRCDGKQREQHPRVHPIWFDPWRYHSREEVWRGIIAEVILALFSVERADSQNILPRLVQAAKKFGAFLGKGFLHALAAIEAKIKVKSPGPVEGEVSFKGEAARYIWEEYDKANHPEKAHLNEFEDTLRTWVRDFMPKNDDGSDRERIAIFIDDLDRCLPAVTLEVLEALKLYLNIGSLIFVVGLDRDVVNAVVEKEYRDKEIPADKARSYLDKIFQVDLTIPPSEEQMGGFMKEQIIALNKATSGYWHNTLSESGHQARIESTLAVLARNNPREVKRLLNSALIRGRTAALDKTLDNKLGMSPRERATRFAQGIQIFLLQRLVRNALERSENLLVGTQHVAWFKKASDLAITAVGRNDPEVQDGESLAGKLASLRREPLEQKPPQERLAGIIEKQFQPLAADLAELNKHLATNPPTRDDGTIIDTAFWDKPLLWEILLIPFSQEVTQNAPKLDAPAAPADSPDALLAQCPPAMRERLASEAGVPVSSLTMAALAGLTGLEFKGMEINPAGLKLVGKLSQLQSLFLSGTGVSEVSALAGLRHLKRLDLGGTKVSDVSALVGVSQLRWLGLGGTKVSEVNALASLRQLQCLYLNGTQVSEVSALAGLRQLQRLGLSGTGVSEVSALGDLSQLQRLDLRGTKVSEEQVTALKSKLPNCDIRYSPTAVP